MDVSSPQADQPGLVASHHLADLVPFLAESISLYDLQGNLKARLSPPDGLLGVGESVGANVFANLHPDDLPIAIDLSDRAVRSGPEWSSVARLRLGSPDGGYRPYEIRVFNRVGDPNLDGIVVSVREAVPDLEPEDAVRTGPLTMADALPTPYLVIGYRGNIRYSNVAAGVLLATGNDDLFGRPLVDLVADEDRASLRAAVEEMIAHPGQRTAVARTRPEHGGRLLEINLHATGPAERSTLVAVALVDRTHEPELIRAATHDPLTGLANRTKLTNTVTGLLLELGSAVTVAYLDLDRFKELNDTFGHAVGDRVLVAVAEQLRARTRAQDLVGRMGGDEFVVVCPGISPESLEALLNRLRRPIWVDDDPELRVVASVGAASAQPGDTADDLLERADRVMYEAKRAGQELQED